MARESPKYSCATRPVPEPECFLCYSARLEPKYYLCYPAPCRPLWSRSGRKLGPRNEYRICRSSCNNYSGLPASRPYSLHILIYTYRSYKRIGLYDQEILSRSKLYSIEIVTNSIQQSPSWKSDNSSASQNITSISGNSKVHCHVHRKSTSGLHPEPNECAQLINQLVHTFTPYPQVVF
jgi:hypothetical protein